MEQSSSELEQVVKIMGAALEGEFADICKFYKLFLELDLFVPERNQAHKMSNQPSYPDPFLNVLAVQSNDRVVVPIFLDSKLIKIWSGLDLTYRKLSVRQIFDILPENWWLVLNPGQAVEKEFSPDEIKILKDGNLDEIESMSRELSESNLPNDVKVKPLKMDEHTELRRELKKFLTAIPEFEEAYLIQELCDKIDEPLETTILVGVCFVGLAPAELEQIIARMKAQTARYLIGGEKIRFIVKNKDEMSIEFGIFIGMSPEFKRTLLSRILNVFRKSS